MNIKQTIPFADLEHLRFRLNEIHEQGEDLSVIWVEEPTACDAFELVITDRQLTDDSTVRDFRFQPQVVNAGQA